MGLIAYLAKVIDKIDTAYAKAFDEGGLIYTQILFQALYSEDETACYTTPIYQLQQKQKPSPDQMEKIEGIEKIVQEA